MRTQLQTGTVRRDITGALAGIISRARAYSLALAEVWGIVRHNPDEL